MLDEPIIAHVVEVVLVCHGSLSCSSGLILAAPPAIPDPSKLVATSELDQIIGPLKGTPKPGGPGEVSCEYTPAKAPAWFSIALHDGDLRDWKTRNGGKSPISVAEFGAGAFVNPDFYGSAELYAKKGNFILRVSIPKGPTSVDTIKAVARKALPRL
ncbi:MAG: hypothetical protein ABI833_12380 [Acidobacteriota bacterium]